MKGQCCICTELFQLDSDIAATQCGHTFHCACLHQWIQQSKTCPHCRKKVNEKYIVEKLFFDAAPESCDEDDDVCVLRNQVAELKACISEKKKEKKELRQENQALEHKIEELRDSFRVIDQLYKQEKNNVEMLKKELKFHKELEKDAVGAREEAKMLRNKLAGLRNVELMVNGNDEEIKRIMSTGDVKQLSTWCCVLQKELQNKRQECKSLRETVEKLRKDFNANKRLLNEKTKGITTAEKQIELLTNQLLDADGEVLKLKKKLNALEKALESPTDTVRSFAHRLLHESPAPQLTPPNKKPKLSDPNNSVTSPDMFASPALPARDQSRQSENNELETKYVKITSAAATGSKIPHSKISDISNIHSIVGYNLFKKRPGLGLDDVGSAIRKGYNGLGGHEKFVTSQGFKMPAPAKKQSKFGPSRSIASSKMPPLPTLDTFMNKK